MKIGVQEFAALLVFATVVWAAETTTTTHAPSEPPTTTTHTTTRAPTTHAPTTHPPTTHAPTTHAPPTVPPAPTRPPLPAAVWSSCPTDFLGIYDDCANVTVWSHWEVEKDQSTVSFLLGRLHPTPLNQSAPPLSTLWYLGEACLIHSLDGWVTQARVANSYVVAVHVRGSRFAFPSIECPPSMTDSNGYPMTTCGPYLQSTWDMSAFTITETAKDLAYVIPLLNGADLRTIIVADGLGSLLAQRLQVVSPSLGHAYLLADVTTPGAFDLVETALRYGTVARRVLNACDNDVQCIPRFGGQDPWDLWSQLLTSADQGLLACTSLLQWDVPSYRTALANLAAMLFSPSADPDTAGNGVTASFFPSIVYRLQRCNEGDAAVITNLNAVLTQLSTQSTAAGLCVRSHLRFHWYLNEMTHASTLSTPNALIATLSTRAVQPNSQFIVALSTIAPKWPTYTVTPEELAIGNSDVPTYLFAGDGDAVMPIELAQMAAAQYSRATQTFIRVAGGVHSLLTSNGANCLQSAVVNIIQGTAVATTCQANPALDVLGSTLPVQIVVQFLGVADLWNVSSPSGNAVTLPPSGTPAPSHGSGNQSGGPSNDTNNHAAVALGILFAIAVVVIVVLIIAYRRRGQSSAGGASYGTNVQSDFYAQLRKQ